MRFVVITRLISLVPPDQLPSLVERFAEWREDYKDRTESFEFFAGDTGGFMVVNATDEIEFNRMMVEYPLTPYVEMEIRPIIDGDTGLAQWWQVMRRMLGDSS